MRRVAGGYDYEKENTFGLLVIMFLLAMASAFGGYVIGVNRGKRYVQLQAVEKKYGTLETDGVNIKFKWNDETKE